MPAGGGPVEALTFNDAVIQTSPAISPDGRTLAFQARTGRGAKIYLLDLARESAWPRLLFPEGGEETSPNWGPDGNLAFARSGDIWVLPPFGKERRRIIEAPYGGGNGGAVWSPDGSRMAFTKGASGYVQVGVVDIAERIVEAIGMVGGVVFFASRWYDLYA